ncbi:MAG: hypothetical protein MJ252_04635 [archaeon]|nr:hypothetical protein [archaeon]
MDYIDNRLENPLDKSINLTSEGTYDDSKSNLVNFSFRELCESQNVSFSAHNNKAELTGDDVQILNEYIQREKTVMKEKKTNIKFKSLKDIKEGLNDIEHNIGKYLDIPFYSGKKGCKKSGKVNLSKALSSDKKSEEEKKIKVKEAKKFEEDFAFENEDL